MLIRYDIGNLDTDGPICVDENVVTYDVTR